MKSTTTKTPKRHWSKALATDVTKTFPEKGIYVCASGISPSGVVHFGNFRDAITSFAVYKELQNMGKEARLIFSWDDFDRFRKVPSGIDPSFKQYIGCPLSDVPCPEGRFSSYAEKFEKDFEKSMSSLGIDMEYRYQTQEYKSGKYDHLIIHALKQRKEIAKILLSFMSDKAKTMKSINPEEYTKDYYPLTVYSSFSGKDNTKIINYDGDKSITYKCFDSGKTETVDITECRIVKLSWKTDWPMRWDFEGVVFEPGGEDHSTPGGSYDVSSQIAKNIFQIKPPIFTGYGFVGIQGLGVKMSGSMGNIISPKELLDIYTPEILKWIYFSKKPRSAFSLSFDTELYRQYGAFDKEVEKFIADKSADPISLELSGVKKDQLKKKPIPFRQMVALGQLVQWNLEKVLPLLEQLELDYSTLSIQERLPKAKAWLETYNPEEMISLLDKPNSRYIKQLSEEEKEKVHKLRTELSEQRDLSISELNVLVYSIPKKEGLPDPENAKLQRDFFKVVYNLLIGEDTGPRLSTFLWVTDRDKILLLLTTQATNQS